MLLALLILSKISPVSSEEISITPEKILNDMLPTKSKIIDKHIESCQSKKFIHQ